MYCGECGTKNEKDAKFCENCGAALEQEEEKKEEREKKSQQQKHGNRSVNPKRF